ncbi:hypothetical protein JHK82_039473 [Glycine max]|uniref:RING-CH-type domain-containing protein n=1 Tax=Glycine soja TaxID=3848 RepID=A0A0B2REQ5_GLYSO|nr:hypothetical protein JHK86_039655 [Glycine max]KAG4965256.1 hypothetical protein JHK85_040231 [Glycine max]KAG5110250.1 hypothetical protein JHK82_039473 [Glycine max]KAG5121538.1 hypothetical protein JHK84_039878 [Glycine max]KHN31790.1 hypothetical protein glysoja_048081 [Glycine soja]
MLFFISFISILVFLILGLLLAFDFVQYAHRKCVHHWCDEKGDITCEICLSEVAGQYGTPLEFCDPRLLAIAEAERQFLDVEYDEYAASNVRGVAFFRSTTLILFLLHAARFLLPCYIMAWAISILQHRQQRQVSLHYSY